VSTRTKVAILFGGRSAEHQISLLSAQNIYNALDRSRFEPVLIGIDQDGQWYYYGDQFQLENPDNPKTIRLTNKNTPVILSQICDDHRIHSRFLSPSQYSMCRS